MTYTAKQLEEIGITEYSDNQMEQRYIEMIDEVYGEVEIAGYKYPTSKALADVDPTAFRCGFADFISSEFDNGIIEVQGRYFDGNELDEYESEKANAEYNSEPEINPDR